MPVSFRFRVLALVAVLVPWTLATAPVASAEPVALAEPAASAEPVVERLWGSNRYETAAAVSASFPVGVDRVYVATGTDFPDALAAAAVAGLEGAPVLLVHPDRLPASTATALERLRPRAVTILGGPSAVSTDVARAVAEVTGAPVDRIAGRNRYVTAAELVDQRVAPGVDVAYVATGASFADSLAGGPAAASAGGPLLLVTRTSLPARVAEVLTALRPGRIVVLGGTSAVSDRVLADLREVTDGPVVRRAGPNRYETAAATVAAAFPSTADTVYLATGADYPDALGGGALAGRDGRPLLIARRDCIPTPILEQLERLSPQRVVVLGGPSALFDDIEDLRPCTDDWVRATTIARDLDVPWDLDFTPDGTAFFTERDRGLVRRIDPDGTVDPDPVLDLSSEVDNDHEGGLLGLAVSPTFADDGWLYALYVGARDQRIVRFTADGTSLEEVVTGLPIGAPGNLSHFAGRIAFGPDGMLYVGVGDVRDEAAAQDLDSLKGKILRYTPDGEVPAGNPFGDSPVWALGFRDPQGLAWDERGRMYASEFGPNVDDEVNRIFPGGNYGWPVETGTGGAGQGFVDPIVVRQPPQASWSGATVLQGGAIPQWEGDLFVAALRGTRLYRIDLDDGRVQGVEDLRVGVYGRMRHVVQAPDGSLWVLTSNQDDNGNPVPGDDRIIRFGP